MRAGSILFPRRGGVFSEIRRRPTIEFYLMPLPHSFIHADMPMIFLEREMAEKHDGRERLFCLGVMSFRHSAGTRLSLRAISGACARISHDGDIAAVAAIVEDFSMVVDARACRDSLHHQKMPFHAVDIYGHFAHRFQEYAEPAPVLKLYMNVEIGRRHMICHFAFLDGFITISRRASRDIEERARAHRSRLFASFRRPCLLLRASSIHENFSFPLAADEMKIRPRDISWEARP